MLKFSIILLIRHPSIDPSAITNQLGLNPSQFWRQGDQRTTPKGKVLPGAYSYTSWSYCFDFSGERSFFHSLKILLENLEQHKLFFEKITFEGGQIYLNINLRGDENIGDVISWQIMEKLGVLKINLGVEVFPNF